MKEINKLVYGAGVNDAGYDVMVNVNGKKVMCSVYVAWSSMIRRGCCAKFKEKHPAYHDVKVCHEWKSFMAFREWWMSNHIDGYHLDKDLLSDSKVYSPETCIYVPRWLNNFTVDGGTARNGRLIGAWFDSSRGKFEAQCNNPFTKKQERLGRFESPLDAHNAWKSRKLEMALKLKDKMDEIDVRIYPRVIEIINRASNNQSECNA